MQRFNRSLISKSTRSGSNTSWRHLTYLGGGFNKEGFKEYAKYTWYSNSNSRRRTNRPSANTIEPYTDLFHTQISHECNQWLSEQPNPSHNLVKAFFTSRPFQVEQKLLSIFYNDNCIDSFPDKKTNFLAWQISSLSQLETICEWKVGNIRGFTTVAYDSQLRRIYHGNVVDIPWKEDENTLDKGQIDDKENGNYALHLWKPMIDFHTWYAKILLNGMKDALEEQRKHKST